MYMLPIDAPNIASINFLYIKFLWIRDGGVALEFDAKECLNLYIAILPLWCNAKKYEEPTCKINKPWNFGWKFKSQ